MKKYLFLILFPLLAVFAFGQQEIEPGEMKGFEYVEMPSDFDLLIEYTFLNPECATEEQYFYSILIGTAVVNGQLERVSVLIPCLGNEFQPGSLVVIRPMPVPTGNITYAVRTYKKGDVDVSDIFGSEYRAVWGNVVEVL